MKINMCERRWMVVMLMMGDDFFFLPPGNIVYEKLSVCWLTIIAIAMGLVDCSY